MPDACPDCFEKFMYEIEKARDLLLTVIPGEENEAVTIKPGMMPHSPTLTAAALREAADHLLAAMRLAKAESGKDHPWESP